MDKGYYHFHRRKRVYKNLEPYPAQDKVKNTLDKVETMSISYPEPEVVKEYSLIFSMIVTTRSKKIAIVLKINTI